MVEKNTNTNKTNNDDMIQNEEIPIHTHEWTEQKLVREYWNGIQEYEQYCLYEGCKAVNLMIVINMRKNDS